MRIGIVGAGISGLHLALRLQQNGIPTTVYSPRTVEEQVAGRPVNFVARFDQTRQRERQLGAEHWALTAAEVHHWQITVSAEPPLRFRAGLTPPSSVVDFRIYLPRLLDDYLARGGELVVGPVDTGDAAWRRGWHDLVVVANGWRSIERLFPRDPDRSPYTAAQRLLCAGLYRGVVEEYPQGLDYVFLPGLGEVLCMPFYSVAGRVDVLAVEAVPDGPLAAITRWDQQSDPVGFHRELLALLARYAPGVRQRVKTDEFGLARPVDLLQGSVTPVVRQGWAELPDGRPVLAVGDAWIVNDPITAQGANLGSRCAFLLADAITGAQRLDREFCQATERLMWSVAEPVVRWANLFLGPPPPHALALFAAAAEDPAVARAFVNMFNDPVAMWRVLSTPEGVTAFLRTFTGGDGPAE